MSRRQRFARCKLMAWPGRLQLRVLVDGEPVLEDICDDAADAFALAEHWKGHMLERGWQQIVPHRPGTAAASRQRFP
jgi:hypothetical protein